MAEDILSMVLAALVVLSVIGSVVFLRLRALSLKEKQLAAGNTKHLQDNGKDIEKLKDAMRYTLEENEALKERVEALETIVTSVEWERQAEKQLNQADSDTHTAS